MNDEKNKPLLVPLSDVQEKTAEWLVPGYMPRGQINIWAGDGGSGKTTAWCGLVAAISAGQRVFFENDVPDEFIRDKPEKVIFFSSEDSLEYTLKARLRKAGANMENIYSVSLKDERFSQIKFNSQLLKELIREVRPALVVFDPLQAFIPPEIQMGQRNAMRNCLNPLIGLGEEYGTTFVICRMRSVIMENCSQQRYLRSMTGGRNLKSTQTTGTLILSGNVILQLIRPHNGRTQRSL